MSHINQDILIKFGFYNITPFLVDCLRFQCF